MYNILNMLNAIWIVFSAGIEGYCLQYFYGSFLMSRISGKYLNRVLPAALYAVLSIGIKELITMDYGSLKTVIRLVLIFGVLIALAFCFYRAANAVTAFLVVTFMAVNEISFFLSYMVLMTGGSIMDLYMLLVNKGFIITPGMITGIANVIIITSQISMYISFALLLYFSLRKIVRDFCEKDYAIRETELLFLLTPSMIGFLMCVFLRIIIITMEDGIPKLVYDKYPILLFLVPVILILSLLSILYVVRLFQDMIYLNREKSSRIVLEKQLKSLQEHMEEMERIHAGIRGMKHDMRNTLSVILQLAGENPQMRNEELAGYLSELNKSMDRLDFHFKTGNNIADILLNMKYHEIIKDVPDIVIDADRLIFYSDLLIRGYDIGIILGNALDNAIEACRKLKRENPDADAFIRLISFRKEKMFFIDISNSFNGSLIKKQKSEFPATDKEDNLVHGMGLINIKNAVEKYHGAVDWSVNNQIFTLSIMMKNERREEDVF